MTRLLPIVIGALLLLHALPLSAGYRAPRRSHAQVSYAIRSEGVSEGTAKAWARILVKVAEDYNFDPLTGWAIIAHESHWRPGAVGAGKDIGLAQIRYTVSSRCHDPESEACRAWRDALFDPATNMRQMATAIDQWRKTCKKRTGKADLKHVLQGYGGYSRGPILCGRQKVKGRWRDLPVPKAVQDILRARHAMIRTLSQKRIR